MKSWTKFFKRLGLVGLGLCVACCLLPVAGVLLGLGALTYLSGIVEMAGIIAMVATAAFFIIYYFRGKRAPSCDMNCASKERSKENVRQV